ncbi:MAG: methionyl-tRNA formyltransferase [Burkholderiaceae bacterium]
MRLIFAGTPDFAKAALERLLDAGHEVALVLTQPDRPAGRGMKLQASPVKQLAQGLGLTLAQPRSLRLDGKFPEDASNARVSIAAAQADAMVVAAYGLILPQWVLDDMSAASGTVAQRKLGCLNIHASLLPRWRGAAPIHRAIEAGDLMTGVTIMQMDAGLDTGDMLLSEQLAIVQQGSAPDTTGTLHDKLAQLGARLIIQALELAVSGRLRPIRQGSEAISYAHKIEKQEAQINWSQNAACIERRIRAFNPFPGASSTLRGETLKIWSAVAQELSPPAGTRPGEILALGPAGVMVAALNSVLTLTELQRAGGKRLPLADFLRGFELTPGMMFDLPPFS